MPLTPRRLLEQARLRLGANTDPAAAPRLESELLLCRTLGVDRAFLFAHPDDAVPGAKADAFLELVQRRSSGEPLAYILGEQEFWSLALAVTPEVLIPRPETETLVEAVLERLPAGAPCRVADIGTGSGAIALALATERPDAELWAVDVSAKALAVARGNAERLGMDNVSFHEGSWCAPLRGSFDLIVSNPPYVREDDAHLDSGDLRFEPRLALTPGADEFGAFRAIMDGARSHLGAGGWLLFEHGFEQAEAIRGLLERSGYEDIFTRQDLRGLDRVTGGRRSG